MRVLLVVFAAFLSLALEGAGQTKHKSALDKATFEAYLRHVELYRQAVTYKIDDPKPSKILPGFSEVGVHLTFDGGSRDELFYVSADGQTIVSGEVYNVNQSPFQSNLDRLDVKGAPSFGPADAAVTIVEFGDLQCPDCRMEAPLLHHNVPETFPGKVRVYFKDFPLESLHPWARAAAIDGRCIYHQNAGAFWKFYDWIYDHQQEIEPDNLNTKVAAWAGENGLDAAKLGQCMEAKTTEPEVDQSIAEGHTLDVHGTPTLFINGRKIGGLQWPDLQLVINHELTAEAAK